MSRILDTQTQRARRALAALLSCSLVLPTSSCAQLNQQLSCEQLVKQQERLPPERSESPLKIVLLIDMPDSEPETISRVLADVKSPLEEAIESDKNFELQAYVFAGDGSATVTPDCMNSDHYSFEFIDGTNNEQRLADDFLKFKEFVYTELEQSLSGVSQGSTSDFRQLLQLSGVQRLASDSTNAQVFLWSSLLTEGTDCLSFDKENASPILADKVAERCASADLLPNIGDVPLTILGAGYTQDQPELSQFGRQLAEALCPKLSTSCEVG